MLVIVILYLADSQKDPFLTKIKIKKRKLKKRILKTLILSKNLKKKIMMLRVFMVTGKVIMSRKSHEE